MGDKTVKECSRFREFRIGDVCDVGDGAHAKVARQEIGVPYLTSKNIGVGSLKLENVDYISEDDYERLFNPSSNAVRRPKPGDVLIGIIGTFGNAYRYKESDHFGISSAVAILRPEPKILDSDYLYYYISSRSFQASHGAYKGGSVQGYTNIPTIKALPILIPSIPEQRAIAAVLGALDDKIELNRRMNATLEGLARALFRSWFVDFDPVRAKMAGRATGLPAEIEALFPDGLEVGKEGVERPRGWRTASIDEEFDLTMGQSPPGNSYNNTGDGLPFYQGKTDFGFRFPKRRIFCNAPTRFAEAGDTLVSVRAPVGTVNMATERCCVGRGVAAIRHKSGSRSYTYYTMELLGPEFDQFEAEGTVFGSINKKDFHAISLIAAPWLLISAFEKLVFPVDQAIENNERQSVTLAALRDGLLPRLMRGEVRVKGIE